MFVVFRQFNSSCSILVCLKGVLIIQFLDYAFSVLVFCKMAAGLRVKILVFFVVAQLATV